MADRRWLRMLPSVDALHEGGTMCQKGNSGRHIMLVRGRGNEFFCLDGLCFHQGAKLGGENDAADIEDIAGNLALRCPLHSKRITLAEGREIDRDLLGQVQLSQQVQRTHEVKVDESDGSVWVRLSQFDSTIPSDVYNNPSVASTGTLDNVFARRRNRATEAIKKSQEAQAAAAATAPALQPGTIPEMFARQQHQRQQRQQQQQQQHDGVAEMEVDAPIRQPLTSVNATGPQQTTIDNFFQST